MRIANLDIRGNDFIATLLPLVASPAWKRVAFFLLPYAGVLVGLDIAAHYAEATGERLPRQFLLSEDGGFGEWLEYSLTSATCIMLIVLWHRQRALAYLANAALFAWMTLDNALQFHERFGGWVAPLLARLPLPSTAAHSGEALLPLAIGSFWLAGLSASLRHGRLGPVLHSLIIAGCIAATAVFGVIVDLFSNDVGGAPWRVELAIFIEDGGEFVMIITSFLVALAIFDTERARRIATDPLPGQARGNARTAVISA